MREYVDSDFTPHGAMGNHVARIARAGDKAEAARYLAAYDAWLTNRGNKPRTAHANIGYFTGYFDQETMVRAQDVFDLAHPFLGRGPVSAGKALEAGKRAALGEFNV